MKRFAQLVERLVFTPQRNAKLSLIVDYLRTTPSPDRGYGLAGLAGSLDFPGIKGGLLRVLAAENSDPVLFALSYDFVGDLAETVSLIWQPSGREHKQNLPTDLTGIVDTLAKASPSDRAATVSAYLDVLLPNERLALLKLITGGMRIGVSDGLIRQALAIYGNRDVSEIAEVWHGVVPPYDVLFEWLDGTGPAPASMTDLGYRPVMLAHPVNRKDVSDLDPDDFLVEWKWDGVRAQIVSDGSQVRIYSRSGDDMTAAFPDISETVSAECILDGEILIGHTDANGGDLQPFSVLQTRLNRKLVSKRQMETAPAIFRCYDLLDWQGTDTRAEGFETRRAILADAIKEFDPDRFDLSAPFAFTDWDALDRLRAKPPHLLIEGVMLKRRDSPYLAGRVKGHWYKWKRDPFSVDAVMMYAQRGHGKRSGLYSDFTFGVWTADSGQRQLVPVGKAYFGFTDEELSELDRYVRENTIERFGPVRSVRADPDHGFVLEIAFEGLNRSPRHKSGVAMRFPRIARLRRDKIPAEADDLSALLEMLPDAR